MPDQLETLPARKLVGPIRFCTLDCLDAELADRLRRRPAWRGTSTEDAPGLGGSTRPARSVA